MLVLAVALTVLGFASYAYFAVLHPAGLIRTCLNVHTRRLERHTTFLLLRLPGSLIAQGQFVLVPSVAGIGVVSSSAIALSMALALAVAPSIVLSRQCSRRLQQLERQLETWLLMLANALRATPSTVDAISSTLPLAPAPFVREVDLVVKEIRLGSSLQRALHSMSSRVPSPSIRSALTTIVVASETGGDLSSILQTTASSLRESARLDGVLRTKTAEGRGQLTLLASMPFVLFAALRWLDPSYFDPVMSSQTGRSVLAICASLWLAACVWAYRIVSVDL